MYAPNPECARFSALDRIRLTRDWLSESAFPSLPVATSAPTAALFPDSWKVIRSAYYRMLSPCDSWFLGPRAENSDLLAELVLCGLDSHISWRRDFHPEDVSPVNPGRNESERSDEYSEKLRAAFKELLHLMRDSVPTFSGRYNGHMLSEQTIASQAAYFAAMLYNPNNVSLEVSPVTTRLEVEVADQLARMIGYDPDKCWGHLTSGGTVANFEALWIARNVLYHPVAAASVARELKLDLTVNLTDGSTDSLKHLDLWSLLNVGPRASLDLWNALWRAGPVQEIEAALRARSLATLGYQDYSRKLADEFGDPLPAAVVLTPVTAHYSWEKIVRALGVGANQLVLLPVDAHCRTDTGAMWDSIVELEAEKIPIMACVSVCGTTEEGAVDSLDEIIEVRDRAERELGVTFHIHSDACYGGYAASVTRAPNGARRAARDIRNDLGTPVWPSDKWVPAVSALEKADSVSIDPHKLGYVPYPAGVFLLKDRRGRELVASDPPYLAGSGPEAEKPAASIGRFIFEGSKPGASAAAVWLSQKTVPLDSEGYGCLIASTIRSAHRLHSGLGKLDVDGVRVSCLPEPDLGIVCFVVHHPSIRTLAALNSLNEAVHRQLCGDTLPTPPYLITRTRLSARGYEAAVERILSPFAPAMLETWKADPAASLTVLRSTVMNPFSASSEPDHVTGLVEAIGNATTLALISESLLMESRTSGLSANTSSGVVASV